MIKKVLFLILATFLLSACNSKSNAGETNLNAAPESVPAEYAGMKNPFGAEATPVGAEIFKTNCTACHGESGHGDGPAGAALDPQPRNLAEFQDQAADDYLFWRISEGKEGTAMVAWKGVLTEDQIWQVIAFIRTLK